MVLVLHFADLHIGKRNPVHIGATFDRIGEKVRELSHAYPGEILAIVAGDIFDHKVSIRSSEGLLFHHFMRMMTRADGRAIRTIMIPGNHDLELGDIRGRAVSLISIFEDAYRDQLRYFHDSAEFVASGLSFYHFSVTDPRHKSVVGAGAVASDLLSQVTGRILLYHGFVDGLVMGSHVQTGTAISREVQKAARLVIAGDIHDRQKIGDSTYYSGTPMQQTYADEGEYGFMIHDIPTHSSSPIVSKFAPIPATHRFRTVDLTAPNSTLPADTADTAEGCLRILLSRKSDYEKYANRADLSVVYRIPQIAINCANMNQSIARLCPDLDAAMIEELAGVFTAGTREIAGHKWSLLRLQWRNLFCYSDSWSVIDFTKMAGCLSGVVAPNCAGKSAIIDIIGYALFNTKMRGYGERLVRNGRNCGDVIAEIEVAGQEWTISRRITSDTKGDDVVLYSGTGEAKKMEARGSGIVYERLLTMVGGIEKASMTAVMRIGTDLIHASPVDRANILAGLFRLPSPEELKSELDRRKKELAALISGNRRPESPESYRAALAEAEARIVRAEEVLQAQCTDLPPAPLPPSRSPESYDAEIAELRGKVQWVPARNYEAPIPMPNVPRPMLLTTRLSQAKLDAAISAADKCRSEVELTQLIAELDSRKSLADWESRQVRRANLSAELSRMEERLAELGSRGTDPAGMTVAPEFSDSCSCCAANRAIFQSIRISAAYPEISSIVPRVQELSDSIAAIGPETIRPDPELKAALQSELAASQRGTVAKTIRTTIEHLQLWAEYDDYCQYQIAVSHRARLAELAGLRAAAVEQMAEWNAAYAATEMTRVGIAAARSELQVARVLAGERAERLRAVEAEIAKYEAVRPAIERGEQLVRAFASLLKGGNLTRVLFYEQLESVLEEASKILKQSQLDFRITLLRNGDVSGTGRAPTIDFARTKESESIPLRFASGYEQFAASLAMRIAFTRALGDTADFMIVDEGFGCLDGQNLPKITNLLRDMSASYRFFFIISHIAELHNALDRVVTIDIGEEGRGNKIHGAIELSGNTELDWPPYPAPAGTVWCKCNAREPVNEKNRRHVVSKRHQEWVAEHGQEGALQ